MHNFNHQISIRFYSDLEVRAVWCKDTFTWLFSAVDVCASISKSKQPRKYWNDFKKKLCAENIQLSEKIGQLKLKASDGKFYLTDIIDSEMVVFVAKKFPKNKGADFLEWFLYSDNSLDGQSKKKAYSLYESNLLNQIEVGTVKGLQQIHAYIFGGLYDFAGQIRSKNISKGGFSFALYQHFASSLSAIENMAEASLKEIIDKYVEMNVAHPFMEGNGRSTRIWLDLMLKRSLKQCVDWSKINKTDYLMAMAKSVNDTKEISTLLSNALTSNIDDRDMFMKGIDYSYYYEQEE
ncbi:MAG: Fic family protein [Bacillota bacterium]